jgi:endonuclease/exonuclease/phosphatase family metal-dependent hydrolase
MATWNLRAFGGLSDKWVAGEGDSPKRDLSGLRAIGEIVARFDVVALQEVRGNPRALRHLLAWLNRHRSRASAPDPPIALLAHL